MASIKNFQVDRNKKTNADPVEAGKNMRKKESKYEKTMNVIALRVALYRFRPDMMVKEYLGFQLKMFQAILIFAMQHNHYFMYLASRGQGKSWLSAVYACYRAILYPHSIIVVASGTKGQAISVLKKIDELRSQSINLAREIEGEPRLGANDPHIKFRNGSVIRVVTSNDNARSARAHVIIVDEFRMVDFAIIQKVLRKFLSTPRQAPFMEKPEYENYEPERNKEIYLSSAWFKSHWSWERAKTYFEAMVEGRKYFLCGLPYQLPVKEKLLLRQQVLDEMAESDFNELMWQMEMECLWQGESENAFFEFEDIYKARQAKKVAYPKELSDMVRDRKLMPPKEKGELRFISLDIATSNKKNADASSFHVSRAIPTKTGYEVTLMHAEAMEGELVQEQALRFNQLKKEFDVDYGILDANGSGIGVYHVLVLGMTDPDTGYEYPPLSSMNDPSEADICPYPHAEKCIYTMKASAKLNSDIAYLTKNLIKNGSVKLPIHETEADEYLEKIEGFKSLDAVTKNRFRGTFIQTTLLINEMMNLEGEYNDLKQVSLKAPRSGRKDKYSSFSYMLFLVDHIFKKERKRNTVSAEDYAKAFKVRMNTRSKTKQNGMMF